MSINVNFNVKICIMLGFCEYAGTSILIWWSW